MVWLLVGFFALAAMSAFFFAAASVEDAQKKAELNERTKTRTEAYIDYIRRTSTGGWLDSMTDAELKDLISGKIRSFQAEEKKRQIIGGLFILGGIGLGIVAGISAKQFGPVLTFGAGGVAAGISYLRYQRRRIETSYRHAGFDPDRLRINV